MRKFLGDCRLTPGLGQPGAADDLRRHSAASVRPQQRRGIGGVRSKAGIEGLGTQLAHTNIVHLGGADRRPQCILADI
jgi:hypothetical protein